MHITPCTFEQHGPAILEMLNDAILYSTAVYDYSARTLDTLRVWFDIKHKNGFPVIGAVDAQDTLMGFATYGAFRNWQAYKYTVEHSVFVHKDFQNKAVGTQLLRQLIVNAQNQQYHVMIGGIDHDNHSSIALHKKLGFTHAGTLREVGYKFGRWLDLDFYQLILSTPLQPQEG